MSPRPRVWIAVVLLFLAVRLPLLLLREPFFDELVTVWYAKKPIASHWPAMAKDSGSPLYLAVARAAEVVAGFEVTAGRILSLFFGFITLALALRYRSAAGMVAAAILSVYPPHVFFSTEARAYSMAAMFVGIGVLALWRWTRQESGPSSWTLAIATGCLVLAAYTHSYGVLFFPLPFVVSLLRRTWVREGFLASAAAGMLFIPGFWLASMQPMESIRWMADSSLANRLGLVSGVFLHLGFAAPYPAVVSVPPPVWLQLASTIVVAGTVVWGCLRSEEARFYLVTILVPICAVFAFAIAGRTFYFPVRFESMLSLPFVLLLASSLLVMSRSVRIACVAAMLTIGILVAVRMTLDHAGRDSDPYRNVAELVTGKTDPSLPIVASSYAYLEVISRTDRAVIPFPRQQGDHPGWSTAYDLVELREELGRLPRRFVWVGAVPSREASTILGSSRWQKIGGDGFVTAVLVER